MWIGTAAGLDKYDGYGFTKYKHDAADSTSLSAGWVLSIYEDRSGTLWVGTYGGGLNRFDRATERFTRFIHAPNHPQSLSTNTVKVIYEDRTGALWVGTDEGLNQFNRDTQTFTRFLHEPPNSPGLRQNNICAIYEDRFHTLWIGTESSGLYQFDRNTKKFTRIVHDPNNPHSLSDNTVRSFYEDRAGRLWLGTGRGGLNQYDHATQRFTRFVHDPKNPHGLSYPEVWTICEDRWGKIWLGLVDGGLNSFDPATQKFTHYVQDPKNPYSLSNNRVSSLCVDRTGTLWVGTSDGINKWDRGQAPFVGLTNPLANPKNSLHNYIWSICKDRFGDLWIGTYNGLFRRTQDEHGNEQVTYFVNDPQNPHSLSHNMVYAIYEDRAGTLWIGTDRGLDRFDRDLFARKKSGQSAFIRWKDEASAPVELSRQQIFSICEEPAAPGTLWIGASSGLFRLLRNEHGQNQITAFKHDPENPASLSSDDVRPLYFDRAGTLWIGTRGGGLNQFDRASERFVRFMRAQQPDSLFLSSQGKLGRSLGNDVVRSLHEDRDGRLWIGTDGGLDQFDRTTQTFRHYTEKDGLPDNTIWGILEDDRGCLWLSTNNGLSRFEAATSLAFKNYTVRDGLAHQEFNRGASFKSHDGEMFFGGINGVTAFHPDSIQDNPFVPPVVITAFKRFNTDEAEGIPIIEKGISAKREINLSYKDNIITFEFTALNFRNPEKNQYAYQLAGYSDQWIQLGTHREATFTNLDPGEYVLRVKGSNNDGVWNEVGTSLKIVITPPWWKTWWAYALFAGIFFGLLYGLRLYEVSRQQLKYDLEMKHVLAEQQQSEAERMKELDRLKSRFFANISHEFRTPLTLILGQLESMKTLAVEAKLKTKIEMAWRNARQLLRLINQLLDLSKLEAGRMELRAVFGDIVPLLQRLTNSFESLAALKRIQLRFASASREIRIYHEPEKIEKIMHNLLSNALKFTPEGGKVSVHLSVNNDPAFVSSDQFAVGSKQLEQKQLNTDHWLLITVRDSGVGISQEHLPHVFDLFYQVDGSVTREHEGTGIGLALTKELVELHGGEITVTSEEDFGTVFTVRLPFGLRAEGISPGAKSEARKTPSDDEPVTIDPSIQPSTDPFIQHPASSIPPPATGDKDVLLIVEDNADLRFYLRENLEDRFHVWEAGNGEEGLSKAQELIPDLVITDVMMPKMDGYTFSKRLKSDEKTSHIPIIVLTAKAEEADKIAGLEIGVDDYLLKPFSPHELRARVRNLIETRRRLRERFSQAPLIKPSEVTVTAVDQKFLERLKAIIEAGMEDESFDLPTLSAKAGLSERQLERKLKALIGQTPNQLIRSMRLHRAKQLLEQNAGTVSEIAYMVGFNNIPYFSKAFREAFGKPPSEMKSAG